MNKKTVITKDLPNRMIKVNREFDASPEKVWRAWTERELLDQWWAPRPWKAETKTLDFREGGVWIYCMAGPDGSKNWCRTDFQKIEEGKSFSCTSTFSDENGVINNTFPMMYWKNTFSPLDDHTLVEVEIRFDSEADLQKVIDSGFESGFTMAHSNLDELLETQKA